MKRVLIILAHPSQESLIARISVLILQELAQSNCAFRLRDLYQEGFDPVLVENEWHDYFKNPQALLEKYRREVDDLAWADTLILLFPTWTYGVPAVLKGWFDKSFLPNHAFVIPGRFGLPLTPKLQNIKNLICITSGGSPRWLTWLIGHPARRMILRGCRMMFAFFCRTKWFQLYRMDQVSEAQRQAYTQKVTAYIRLMANKNP